MTRVPERLLTSRMVRLCLLHLRQTGGNVDDVVRRYQIPPEWDSVEDVSLPAPALRASLEEVAERLGDPEFGVTLALSVPRGAFGLYEYVARHERTLGDAMRSAIRYSALYNGAVRYSLEVINEEAIFDIHLPDEPLGEGRHGNDFVLAVFLKIGRELVSDPLIPIRAWVAHPEPTQTERLVRFVGVRPDFGSGHTGFALPSSMLERPLSSSDPALREILSRQAETALQTVAPADDFLAKVRERLAAALPNGAASMERIASALHMSGRTLQRRLRDLDTTFEELLDQVRQAQSMTLLNDPRLSIGEIAFLLGYSDQATFTRAFKRWTGKAPGEVRKS